MKKLLKTESLGSNVENLGKLSVHQMKNDHGLASTFVAKAFPDLTDACEAQSGEQAKQDQKPS